MSRDYKFHNHRTERYVEDLSYDKNGNISSIAWRTKTDNITRGYGYDYDHLNRLNYASNLKALGGPSFFVNLGRDGQYAEDLSYDKNGNITTLKRYGQEELGQPIEIDDLTYTYTANQLQTVTDATNNPEGFNDGNTTGVDYTYDSFGNMITDKNKNITAISYNHLNLPYKVTFANGGNISFVYDATGIRLSKKIQPSGGALVTTDYINGFQYENNALKFFKQAEGFVEYKNNQYIYHYIYKDHLGNNRLVYADLNGNGVIDPATEIIEENNYYPFGLKHKGYNELPGEGYKYKYNGKELQDELGLNMYDYGARNYDPALGRWNRIDNKAEIYYALTPYNYAGNTPVQAIDVDGNLFIFVNGFMMNQWMAGQRPEYINIAYDSKHRVMSKNPHYSKYAPDRGFYKDGARNNGKTFRYWTFTSPSGKDEGVNLLYQRAYGDHNAYYTNGSFTPKSTAKTRFAEG